MKKNVIRLLMAFVAFMTAASMTAENKLWIDNFSVSGIGTVVDIQMKNDPSVAALQFMLEIPEGLELVQTEIEDVKQYVYRNSARLNNTQTFMCTPKGNGKFLCAVFSMSGEPFIGTEGPVAYFKVKSTVTDVTGTADVKLTKVIMSTASGDQVECDSEFTASATINAEILVDSSADSFVVNPGTQFTFPIEFTNSTAVQGLQMDVTLPQGFTMDNRFEHTDRVSNGAQVISTYNAESNKYRLQLIDLSGESAIRNIGSGKIFDCFINVPAEFVSNEAKLVISNVIASYGDKAYPGDGATVAFVNGKDALTTADAVVADLQSKLDAALATIAETCPAVKDNFKGEAEQQQITDLQTAVNNAYADMTLTPNYEEIVTTPAAAIEDAIAKLVEDAKAAQAAEEKRVADNKAAYDATVAAIAALQKNLDDAVTVIDTEYADYKDAEAIADAQKLIGDATAAAKAAFDAVEKEGTYAYELDEAGINTAIEGLVLAAKAAKDAAEAEADRVAANKAAYDATLAALDAVQKNLNDAVAVIDADYAAYKDADAIAAVQAKIDGAKAAAKAAFDAVATEGTYAYELDEEGLNAAVAALVTDAEKARQDANKAAYDKVSDELDALYAHYRDVVAEIQADYKAFEDVSAELAVRNQLDAVKDAIAKAYKAVEKEGTFEYALDAEGLTAAIDQLLADAKAKKDAASAEELRQAENLTAYNKVLADIDALQTALDQAVATIKADYAAFEDKEAEAAVQGQIDALKAAADAAYKAVEKEGKFEYTFDAAPVSEAIAKLVEDAEAKEAARVEANKAAYDAVVAEIAAVQKEFEDAVAEISQEYPEYNATVEVLAITKALSDAKDAADVELEAVEKEGDFSYTFDAQAVRDMIANMVENAKNSGVISIEAELEAGNIRIFTLDGQEHANPVVGEVNVIVRKDGTTSKVMVK